MTRLSTNAGRPARVDGDALPENSPEATARAGMARILAIGALRATAHRQALPTLTPAPERCTNPATSPSQETS